MDTQNKRAIVHQLVVDASYNKLYGFLTFLSLAVLIFSHTIQEAYLLYIEINLLTEEQGLVFFRFVSLLNLPRRLPIVARITCDDCLQHVDNRYDLVHLAAERVKQLLSGFQEPLIEDGVLEEGLGFKKDKETVTALREIAAGLVTPQTLKDTAIKVESKDADLDLNSIIEGFEAVDRQIEEDKRLAEEKEKEGN